MSTQDLLAAAGLVAAGLMAATRIFQIKKIEINPWKTIVRAIGRALTAELSEKMEAAQKSQDQKWEELKHYQEETRRLLDDHVRTDDERNADLLRSRILRFNNELVRGIEHTQEDFDEILCIVVSRTWCSRSLKYSSTKLARVISQLLAFCRWNSRSHSCASRLVLKPRLRFCFLFPVKSA